MNWKAIGGKLLKGTIGGVMVSASTLMAAGVPMGWKPILTALGAGAFHGGYEAYKQLGSTPAAPPTP